MKELLLRSCCLLVAGALCGILWNPQALRQAKAKVIDAQYTPPVVTFDAISQAEFSQQMKMGGVIVLDARSRTAYEMGHIAGSMAAFGAKGRNLHNDLRALMHRDGLIVVVDDSGSGYAAKRLAGNIRVQGYRRVRLLDGGIKTWKTHGGAMATGWDMETILEALQ